MVLDRFENNLHLYENFNLKICGIKKIEKFCPSRLDPWEKKITGYPLQYSTNNLSNQSEFSNRQKKNHCSMFTQNQRQSVQDFAREIWKVSVLSFKSLIN
jgi:hypothetical protein